MCIFIGQVYRKKAEKYILLVLIHIVDNFKSEEKEFHWNNFGSIILMERRKKLQAFDPRLYLLWERGVYFQHCLFCHLAFYLKTNPKFYIRAILNVKANY